MGVRDPMTALTLHGIPSPERLPAIPALDDTLELADAAQRHPSDLNIPEIVKLGRGAEHLESELVRVIGERNEARADAADLAQQVSALTEDNDDLEQVCATLRTAVRMLQRELESRRITAGFESLSITITGRSHSEVSAGLTAAIRDDGARLVDWMSERDARRRMSAFDLSDCTDSVVVDVPVLP